LYTRCRHGLASGPRPRCDGKIPGFGYAAPFEDLRLKK